MKVLIVGAGPAGLACAKHILLNSDFDITVVDKKHRVGENPKCAGGVGLYMMEKAGFTVSNSCIVARIRQFRMYSPNGNYCGIKGDTDYGYVLDRTKFEQEMAETVEGLGGVITLMHHVTHSDLHFWQGQYDYIVGADGPTSVVRQWLGLLPKIPPCDFHLGIQKIMMMDEYPQDTIELYFGKFAPEGYAWIFPGGDSLVRIGLGVPLTKSSMANELLGHFIRTKFPIYSSNTLNLNEGIPVAKLIPTARMPDTGVFDRVLLIGDALPTTDPATGGGIAQGIASGKAAARAIIEGKPRYYDTYIGWLRKENKRRYKLKQLLCSFSEKDLNDLIEMMQGFHPKSMSVGKELHRAAIRLILRKPRLLWKFLTYLS